MKASFTAIIGTREATIISRVVLFLSQIAKKSSEDVFEGPGFKMIRRGRHLEYKTSRSPEQQRDLNRRMRESHPSCWLKSNPKLLSLRRFFSNTPRWMSSPTYSSEIPRVILMNTSSQIQNFVHIGSSMPQSWNLKDAKYQLRLQPLVFMQDVDRAHALLEKYLRTDDWYHLAENANPESGGPPSRMDEIRSELFCMACAAVRPPMILTGETFYSDCSHPEAPWNGSPSPANLTSPALAINRAIETHITEAIWNRVQTARDARKDFLNSLDDYTPSTGVFAGKAEVEGFSTEFATCEKKKPSDL